MKRTRTWKVAGLGLLTAITLVASACAPQTPGGNAGETWQFKGTTVTVNDSQDEVCVIFCVNTKDEPYLINIGFRVKVGKAGSAQTFVVNTVDNALQDVPVNDTRVLNANQQATATFAGVKPLDLLDLTNPTNKLEIVGTYSWAAEEDFIGVGLAANQTADVLKNALNATVAASSLPSDPNLILNLIIDNLGSAIGIIVNDIPTFGLTDDVLGGGIFIGIGATGSLASIINAAIGSTPFPTFEIPIVTLPPDIQGGGFFTTSGGTKNFTQSYSGSGGQHTYTYQAGKV